MKLLLNKILLKPRKTFHSQEVRNLFYLKDNPKILLLRQDRLGDLLVSTSFVRILRQHLPNAQIDILLSNRNIQAKKCVEKYVNNVLLLKKKASEFVSMLWKLRKEKYDIIIDLFDIASTTSGLIIRAANPLFALGIDKENSFIYDYTVPMLDRFKTNIVERICNLLSAFGVDPAGEDLRLEYPVATLRPVHPLRFGLNLAGATANRFWGEANNSALIALIREHYPLAEVQVFFTGEYASVAESLQKVHGGVIARQYPTFGEFAEAVAQCHYMVTPDTSVVHLCASFGVPVVGLYAVVEGAKHSPWYPYQTPHVALTTTSPWIGEIAVGEVWEAVLQLIINK